MAAITAVNTAAAQAYPSPEMKGIPATCRDTKAMITVPPAKMMAPPAVAVAWMAALWGSSPFSMMFRRCR